MIIGSPVVPLSAQSGSITTVPAILYDSSVQTTGVDFNWKYRGVTFTWHVEAPWTCWIGTGRSTRRQRISTAANTHRKICSVPCRKRLKTWCSPILCRRGETWPPGSTTVTTASGPDTWLIGWASAPEAMDYDYFHTAEFIQSFVDAIPYRVTDVPELPAQTIVDNGDCKDKSILLAALLKSLSYKVALLDFAPGPGETAGHMAVGVAIDDSQLPQGMTLSYYRYNGLKYYFAETTSPGWTLGAASDQEPAQVYEVN